jgi:undecaprenyl-diphosphatase
MAAVLLSDRSKFAPLYAATATAIALSRIHVRIHHASDIVGGVVVGGLLGAAVKRLRPLGG